LGGKRRRRKNRNWVAKEEAEKYAATKAVN